MRVAAAILILTCVMQLGQASPLIVQCSADKRWGDDTIHVRIDLVLPKEASRHVFISDQTGKEVMVPDVTPVGVGKIEITEVLDEANQSHRHDFVVTRMPGAHDSLIGFYIVDSYVNSIRADLWDKEKPFVYFDTYNNDVLRGNCR